MPQYVDAQGRPIGGSSAPKRRYVSATGEPLDDTAPAGPVEGGFLDRVSNMSGSDWGALATRVIPGLLSNTGGPWGAAISGVSEAAAQWQEGDFKPWQIASQAGIGAIPFGKLIGSSKPLLEGSGLFSKAVNTATNVAAGTVKGGVVGATTTGIDRAVSEGRMPTGEELKFGTLMGAGGGGLASGAARMASRGGRTTAPPPVSAQSSLPFDVPPAAPMAPRPRILKGKEQYRPSGAQTDPLDPRFGAREPFIREMGDPPSLFGSELDDATQLPFGAAPRQSSEDLIAELLDVPTQSPSSFRPTSRPPSDPIDILTDALQPQGQGSRVQGQIGLMESLRESSDMGQSPFARAGDPEVLPPERPGAARFTKQAGEFGPQPGMEQTPDDMIAELLGLPRTPRPAQAQLGGAADDLMPAGAGSASEPFDLPDVPYAPKPKIPIEITRAWQGLKPKWQATVDAQQGDDIPFTVDPTEDLLPFAKRVIRDSDDPRSLMGAERKAVQSIEPDALERMRQFLSEERGSVNTDLAYDVGAIGAGAVAAPIIEGNTDDPAVSAIGGGLIGLLARRGFKDPKILERIQSSSLFSGAAQAKSALGNIGGVGVYAAEHPGSLPKVLSETFSPETARAAKSGFNRPMTREAGAPETSSVFSYPGRAIGAADEAARDVIRRVRGLPTQDDLPGMPPTAPDFGNLGGQYTLSGDPASPLGKWAIKGAEYPALRALAPVMRTPINFLERGIERLPGIGGTKGVAGWTGGGDKGLVRRRQILGAGALAAGGAAGAAFGESEALPYAAAAMGPYGLPLALGATAGQTFMKKKNNRPLDALGAMLEEAQYNVPLSNEFSFDAARNLRRLVPYGAAMRALSPVDPRDLDTSESFFGPALAQVPLLNELLFDRKRKGPRRPTVQFGRAGR